MCGNAMMDTAASPDWQVLGTSICGASHHRVGLPNQDALYIARPDACLPLIVALADGHGSSKSFRSDCGSRLAVESAQAICGTLFSLPTLLQQKRWAEEHLPRELVRYWRAAVEQDLAERPFTPEALSALNATEQRQVESHPLLAYGSTLLAVVVASSFILYLQLGDGDLLTVSAKGEVERPIPKDSRLIANETTSLCSAQAWNEVQVRFQTLAGTPPALILAATDGYANAYRDEASFQQVARDFWTLLHDEGEAVVKPHLEEWLNEASQQGSGDDITVGIIWRQVDLMMKKVSL